MNELQARELLKDRFQDDCVITLATLYNNRPYARQVDAFYQDGSFYFITSPDSRKVKHIQNEPEVAIAGSWFNATGKAKILGEISQLSDPAHRQILEKFSWFQDGSKSYPHPYTLFVQVILEEGILTEQDQEWKIGFTSSPYLIEKV